MLAPPSTGGGFESQTTPGQTEDEVGNIFDSQGNLIYDASDLPQRREDIDLQEPIGATVGPIAGEEYPYYGADGDLPQVQTDGAGNYYDAYGNFLYSDLEYAYPVENYDQYDPFSRYYAENLPADVFGQDYGYTDDYGSYGYEDYGYDPYYSSDYGSYGYEDYPYADYGGDYYDYSGDFKGGGLVSLLYNKGGKVRHMAEGGDLPQGSLDPEQYGFFDGYGYDPGYNVGVSAVNGGGPRIEASPGGGYIVTYSDGSRLIFDENATIIEIQGDDNSLAFNEYQTNAPAESPVPAMTPRGGGPTPLPAGAAAPPPAGGLNTTRTWNIGPGGSTSEVNANRMEMVDGTFMEDNNDGTQSYFDANGNWLYTADGQGNYTAHLNSDGTTTRYEADGRQMIYNASGEAIAAYDANGNLLPPAQYVGTQPGVNPGAQQPTGQTPRGQTPPGQTPPGQTPPGQAPGPLNGLRGLIGDGGITAGIVGSLIGNLMDRDSGPSGGYNQGVDMAELSRMQQGTGSGIAVGSGRTAAPNVYVPYEQYAYWNPDRQRQLYTDLGVSGIDQEDYYPDEDLTTEDEIPSEEEPYDYPTEYDFSGGEPTPPDEFVGPMPQTGDNPQEVAGVEPFDGPMMYAQGGPTHFTYGTPVRPEDNLGMRRGGLSQAHTVHSHHTNPIVSGRIDFRQGSAVNGAGDGQSDDIPAMLADGEYVIDAETVAQLGNGSNKAGAKTLDKFREAIRAHKRKAPLDKIPPKSKSALAYLKEAMKNA